MKNLAQVENEINEVNSKIGKIKSDIGRLLNEKYEERTRIMMWK